MRSRRASVVMNIWCRLSRVAWIALACLLANSAPSLSLAQTPGTSIPRGSDTAVHFSDPRSREAVSSFDANTCPVTLLLGTSWDEHLGFTQINAFDNGAPCGTFTNGNASGPDFSIGLGIPFLSPQLRLDPELLYRNLSTGFAISPVTLNTFDQKSGTTVPLTRQYTYDASISSVAIALLLDFAPIAWLHLIAGPAAGILIRHSYVETGHYSSTSNVVFRSTGTSSKTIASGSVPVNTFQASFEFGVGFALPFAAFTVSPQILASIPLTNISTTVAPAWKTYSIGAGLTFSRIIGQICPSTENQGSDEQTKEAPSAPRADVSVPPIPALPRPKSALRLRVRALGIGKNGDTISAPTLLVERIHVTEAFPTLNCVFFEDGSSQIPVRYHRFSNPAEVSSFDEKSLNRSDAIGIHHSVLDVIGSRLAMHPQTSITIVGARSATSPLDRIASPDLATARARAIATYFRRIWRIDSTRILVENRAMPEQPSDESTSAGQAENRRVEIESTSNEILAPVWAERTEHVASPPKLLFLQQVNHPITSCRITVQQGDRILQTFDGSSDGAAGEHLWTLDESNVPTGSDSLTFTDVVTDALGNRATATGVIPLRRNEHDTSRHAAELRDGRHIERYSLILFDYSSAQFGTRQADLMIDTIARSIHGNVQLSLTGHTDQTGDPAFNDKLSGLRASTTSERLKERLKSLGRATPPIQVEAHGSRDVLFDNTLPEGRFLSRTVRITVEHDD